MKMNLNGYNAYTAVHNGGLYKATVWRTDGEYPFELRVYYVDDAGARHEEFCKSYKTASEAPAVFQGRERGLVCGLKVTSNLPSS